MIDSATITAFIAAVLAIVVAPSPDTVYIVTQSHRRGRTAGLLAGVSTATGMLVHTLTAVPGLAVLLQTSVLAYTIVKYVGAVYLMYLGVQMIRQTNRTDLPTNDSGKSCAQGWVDVNC